MLIAAHLAQAPGIWRCGPVGDAAVIKALRDSAPIRLPDLYLDFLELSNGGEGDLGVNPGWFSPWAAEEVMDLNGGYHVVDALPGFFAFGSNGGGELLAFDARGEAPWPIVTVPCIAMSLEDAVQISESFEQFARFIGVPSGDF